jgi:hypothetical protein
MAVIEYRGRSVNVFERIIVPLDGSRLSAQAVPYAAEVGKRFDAEIILVRVLPPAGLSFSSTGEIEDACRYRYHPSGNPHERCR